MEEILSYLKQTYAPVAVIVYGSYAEGTNGADSDFDALVVSQAGEKVHDASRVGGVTLDVFVYPKAHFDQDFDCGEILPVAEGRVALDTAGFGEGLTRRVRAYWESLPKPTGEEKRKGVAWCKKMALRAARNDAEGRFRLHWLLADSLEIFHTVTDRPYRGPKKGLKWMERAHPQAYACYRRALESGDPGDAEQWVQALEAALAAQGEGIG